ncbi:MULTISPECIES: TlpA disulfide reductase family protein [Butyricimonas]|uniref:TlpA disulfide reductase family protein n=1 Tax=Butyricimonas TaxID=574697 RepID=UPI001E542CB8|nr:MULTISPECIES: TlpA disulfide reductase family protein [Butyricimonas]
MEHKRINFIALFLIVVGVIGCSSREYKIRGSVEGVDEGKVFLVTCEGKMCDTLSIAELKNGKFEMQGQVPALTVTTLVVEGLFAQTVIYLENAEYEIKLDPRNLGSGKISGGGDVQKLANEYSAIDINLAKAIAEVRDEYVAVVKNPESNRFQELKGFVDSLQQDAQERKEAFLNRHADSYIALKDLAERAERLSLDELKKRFALLPEDLRQNSMGKMIDEQIRKKEALAVGHTAPDFKVQDAEGNFFTLYSIKAKMKIVDFWASWCAPCRALTPQLKALYEEFHNQGLEIVGISMDDNKERWLKAIEEENMTWIQGSNLEGFSRENSLCQLYNITNGIPYLVLMDESNRIVAAGAKLEPLQKEIMKFFQK